MVGEYLHAGADDEHHEEQVEEMQQPEPNGKPVLTATAEAGVPG